MVTIDHSKDYKDNSDEIARVCTKVTCGRTVIGGYLCWRHDENEDEDYYA